MTAFNKRRLLARFDLRRRDLQDICTPRLAAVPRREEEFDVRLAFLGRGLLAASSVCGRATSPKVRPQVARFWFLILSQVAVLKRKHRGVCPVSSSHCFESCKPEYNSYNDRGKRCLE